MRATLRKLIREPLFHFLLLGVVIFFIAGRSRSIGDTSGEKIVVTQSHIESIVVGFSRTWMRPPTQEELQGLVDDYVREEVLYREAKAMRLDQDDIIVVPITTLQKKITGQPWLRWIVVSAVSQQASYTAQEQISSLLRDRHRIRRGQDDDFFVRNLADVADLADQNARLFTILVASIASISLIVGGIGVMNIMLVSVTERTREIGIRMAIGATEHDVQQQFLIEAVVLSLLGGAIGIVVGIASSFLITRTLGWSVLVSPISIIAAVIFSMGVGIFFGFYPAQKAAQLDPIEALRYE